MSFFILTAHGQPLKILSRRSKKAKRIIIKIKHNGAELVLPYRANADIGYQFLLSKEYWIRSKLKHIVVPTEEEKGQLPIFGKLCSVKYIEAKRKSVKLEGNILEVYSKVEKGEEALKEFLKNMLLGELEKLVPEISHLYRLSFSKIRLSSSANKWGSCSSKGVLSFNWRLVFVPSNILRYVIIHEVCHLKEMNHSKKFWDLVSKEESDYKACRLWLKNNGAAIFSLLQ